MRERTEPVDPEVRFFEEAPCGLFLTDEKGMVSAVSDTMLAWLERGRPEVVGKLGFRDMLSMAGRVYAETHLLPMLRMQGGFQEIAMTLRSPSGIERLVLITAASRRIPERPEAAAFVVFGAEHRRRYERELSAMRAAAQTRISWLRQVEKMAGIGAWALELPSRTMTWSDQIFALHDLPVGDAPDLEGLLTFIEDPWRAMVAAGIQRTIETGDPLHVEAGIVTAQGRRRVIRATGEVEREGGRIRRLVGVIQDITDQHESQKRLWRSAYVDELSGVANRNRFQKKQIESLDQAKREGGGLTLLLLDLDGFKEVNDTLGHQAGDEVIRTVAQRLDRCLPPNAFVARLGGDEFAILLATDAGTTLDIPAVADRIQAQVRAPVPYEGHRAFVTVSIGAATFPADADRPDELFKCADMALYKVKRSGRGTLGFFSPEVGATFDARRAAIEKVRNAASEGRITPAYQPKVRLRDRAVCGYEALARIVNRDGTVSGPGAFFHAFDDAESARIIDDHVLHATLRDLVRWRACGHDPGPVSLNVSEFSLQRDDYPDRLLALLARSGVPTSAIELEILETVLLGSGSESLEPVFTRLRRAGVSLALDDFGTGFASLSHLRDLPVNRLKLDKSFVLGLGTKRQNRAIVKAVVELAHNLGLNVVAEGIETEDACAFLRAIGCEAGQGFLFGAALPFAQVETGRPCPPELRPKHRVSSQAY